MYTFYKMMCDGLRDLVPFVQFKIPENTHGGVLLLVNWRLKACNFTKSNTLLWVFCMFFKMYNWYQITQRITIINSFRLSSSSSVIKILVPVKLQWTRQGSFMIAASGWLTWRGRVVRVSLERNHVFLSNI